MKLWAIRWKETREIAVMCKTHALCIFKTRKEARAFQVGGTVVVPIQLTD